MFVDIIPENTKRVFLIANNLDDENIKPVIQVVTDRIKSFQEGDLVMHFNTMQYHDIIRYDIVCVRANKPSYHGINMDGTHIRSIPKNTNMVWLGYNDEKVENFIENGLYPNSKRILPQLRHEKLKELFYYPEGYVPSSGYVLSNYIKKFYDDIEVYLCGFSFKGYSQHNWNFEKETLSKREEDGENIKLIIGIDDIKKI